MKFHRVLLLLMLLSLLINSVRAQETPQTTAEPTTSDLFLSTSIELVSLDTLYSQFVMRPPADDFAQVTLTIAQAGWEGQTVEVDLADQAQVTEPFTDFTHLWNVNPNNPPSLFQDITITWSFQLTNGQQEEFVLTTIYADPRVEWRVDENPEGNVRLALPAGRFAPMALREPLAQVYDLMSENTDQQASVGVVVFDQTVPIDPCLQDAEGNSVIAEAQIPCDLDDLNAIYEANGYAPVQVTNASFTEVQDAVTQSLFEALYTPLWQGRNVPEWFRYGLAQFYKPREKFDLLEKSRQSVRLNRATADMSIVPQDADRLSIWQAQSYGMVQYMAEQIGVRALFELAREVSTEQSIEALYEAAAEQSFDALIPAWGNWIFTDSAELAYQYTPYLPTTLTPAPSPTRTPTLTPSLSPTITPTFTLTVTVGITPTAFPTDLPTNTPTPTVTPRSLSSLFTPTPAPIVTPTSGGDNTPIIVGGGLIAIGVVGLIAVLLFARPRKVD